MQEDRPAENTTRAFYEKFPYPWPPMSFPTLEDPSFETAMLNQSIGDFSHRTVPKDARIWVAGCGTNQAVYTALKFPSGRIVGSDLSSKSLEVASRTAAALNITNLELREESLNHTAYENEFDYILCTGVIHHNADPAKPLSNLSRALRKGGVLELMVYNQFHRVFYASMQQAVRLVARRAGTENAFDDELDVARALLDAVPAAFGEVEYFRKAHLSEVADSLIQPLECSYSVETLRGLALHCGLDLLLPCANPFDVASDSSWTIALPNKELQRRIAELPDESRWQLAHLLKMGRSPMLWFYLRHRADMPGSHYEAAVDESFLNGTFVRATTKLRNYFRGMHDLQYTAAKTSIAHPMPPKDEQLRAILDRADGEKTMRELLREVGIDADDRRLLGELRWRSTTVGYPYLRSVGR